MGGKEARDGLGVCVSVCVHAHVSVCVEERSELNGDKTEGKGTEVLTVLLCSLYRSILFYSIIASSRNYWPQGPFQYRFPFLWAGLQASSSLHKHPLDFDVAGIMEMGLTGARSHPRGGHSLVQNTIL